MKSTLDLSDVEVGPYSLKYDCSTKWLAVNKVSQHYEHSVSATSQISAGCFLYVEISSFGRIYEHKLHKNVNYAMVD